MSGEVKTLVDLNIKPSRELAFAEMCVICCKWTKRWCHYNSKVPDTDNSLQNCVIQSVIIHVYASATFER